MRQRTHGPGQEPSLTTDLFAHVKTNQQWSGYGQPMAAPRQCFRVILFDKRGRRLAGRPACRQPEHPRPATTFLRIATGMEDPSAADSIR